MSELICSLELPATLHTLFEVTDRCLGAEPVFLRYSHGPGTDAHDGPSRDYEAQVTMSGLSVTTMRPEPWWPRPALEWVARRLCKYADLGAEQGRFPWLLTGRVVGAGPDHEPLVTAVHPLATIDRRAVTEARRLYHERFHVGRDSTQ
ncbi:MAG: hypothetical protein H5T78_06785 [Nocardia sp.]|nr:hypothetical protein [Nocardia sp.]